MIAAAQVEIQKTRALLGQMPEQANRLIHFLNTKTSEELCITDRTGAILEIKRVLTKRTQMKNLERRCHDKQVEINSFTEKFAVLHNKGLPSPLTDNDQLMRHIDYVHTLNTYVADQVNASSST